MPVPVPAKISQLRRCKNGHLKIDGKKKPVFNYKATVRRPIPRLVSFRLLAQLDAISKKSLTRVESDLSWLLMAAVNTTTVSVRFVEIVLYKRKPKVTYTLF